MKASIRMPEFVPPGKGAVEGNLDPSSVKGGTCVRAHRCMHKFAQPLCAEMQLSLLHQDR